jgi:pyruvate/2-oxoglutarate dehydrogenase complex dihydrolipoamide dehydrogenase (E3) component
MERFDVIGLGAGSAGAAVARRLARAGRSVALAEAARVGGECPFVACMPSKALLRSAQVRHLIGRRRELGAMSDGPKSGGDEDAAFSLAAQRRDRIVHNRDDSAKARELEELGVRIVRGRGEVVRAGVVVVDGIEYGYDDLVVGTGSSPIWPSIDGLDTVPTWTSDQALVSSDRPRSMAILGGGAVGCELAQIYARFGTQVTLVQEEPRLLGREEASISARLADVLEGDGVELRLSTTATRVEGGRDGARLHLDSGPSLDCERILVGVGRAPNTSRMGLETLGIEVGDSGLAIDETCRVRGQQKVWAAGDVTAVAPYTHTACYQAEIIATNILRVGDRAGTQSVEQLTADYRAIPRAVYTDPPVASVGMDEATAAKKGIRTVTAAMDLTELARAGSDGDGGRLVLTSDRSRNVLIGAAAIGPHADEGIGEAALAIHAEIQLSVLTQLVHLFPTYSEAYGRLFQELAGILA